MKNFLKANNPIEKWVGAIKRHLTRKDKKKLAFSIKNKKFDLVHKRKQTPFLTCQTGKDEKIVNTLCWQGHEVMLMGL